MVGRGPKKGYWNRITIGIQEFLKGFYSNYCDSYRQPTIKRDNPRNNRTLSLRLLRSRRRIGPTPFHKATSWA